MFIIQPGQGLGLSASKEIALALGGFAGVTPPVIPIEPPIDSGGGGRGSGRTTGIQPDGYDRHHEDALLETRRKRILQEDNDIVEFIVMMLTGGFK